MFYDKRHSPEDQKWVYRMMNDPEYFRYIDTINDYNMIIEECQKLYDNTSVTNNKAKEKLRYIDTINNYNDLIEEFQKEYDNTPASDRFTRAHIQYGLNEAK